MLYVASVLSNAKEVYDESWDDTIGYPLRLYTRLCTLLRWRRDGAAVLCRHRHARAERWPITLNYRRVTECTLLATMYYTSKVKKVFFNFTQFY